LNDIKIIALDLDGTLLTTDKRVSERNYRALERAAEKGIEIVPTTGRFYVAMPEIVRNMPFVNYVITINGASVYDVRNQKSLAAIEIPYEEAIAVLAYLDGYDVLYDCYQDNFGWMTASMRDRAAEYVNVPYFLQMVRDFRHPVPELKAYLREKKMDVQKLIAFMKDMDLKQELMKNLNLIFKDLVLTSSISGNIEINHVLANKGAALHKLADCLSVDISQTMSFGDGSNDLPMIVEAGVGVAMKNACPEILAAADRVTGTNDEDGVAQVIEELL